MKKILGVLLVPAFILLLPWFAMQGTDDMAWSRSDFVLAYALMCGVGLTYQLMRRQTSNVAYRAAVGLALATAFMIVWANLAVGIIGSEEHPANLMYAGVLAVGIIGALVARFQPLGMARALFATALAQFLVPVIALIIWKPQITAGLLKTFGANAFFAMLFVGSALLFRGAAKYHGGIGAAATA